MPEIISALISWFCQNQTFKLNQSLVNVSHLINEK